MIGIIVFFLALIVMLFLKGSDTRYDRRISDQDQAIFLKKRKTQYKKRNEEKNGEI